jgi:hypothetical protein
MMDFGGESVRRNPFGHGLGIEERPVNFFRRGPEHTMQSDGIGGHGVVGLNIPESGKTAPERNCLLKQSHGTNPCQWAGRSVFNRVGFQ